MLSDMTQAEIPLEDTDYCMLCYKPYRDCTCEEGGWRANAFTFQAFMKGIKWMEEDDAKRKANAEARELGEEIPFPEVIFVYPDKRVEPRDPTSSPYSTGPTLDPSERKKARRAARRARRKAAAGRPITRPADRGVPSGLVGQIVEHSLAPVQLRGGKLPASEPQSSSRSGPKSSTPAAAKEIVLYKRKQDGSEAIVGRYPATDDGRKKMRKRIRDLGSSITVCEQKLVDEQLHVHVP